MVWLLCAAVLAVAAAGTGAPAGAPAGLGPAPARRRAAPLAHEARLTIVHITDVYTLEPFARLRNLLTDLKAENPFTVCVLTGDFLMPYLLSAFDGGNGMMKMLSMTPVDYVTWGNHEADLPHSVVCKHVEAFQGTWLNSNMPGHEAMRFQKAFDVIKIASKDGSQARRVGLVAVLSNDAKLYEHLPPPGAFGGAQIDCPWAALEKYATILKDCDVILPLQHLYETDDYRTCFDFDFPLILGGHDHHRIDKVVEGTRLIKPGLDGVYCAVVDLTWSTPDQQAPTIESTFVQVASCAEPDLQVAAEALKAYRVLAPLEKSELAIVPPEFRPLDSSGARARVTTMGLLLCTWLLDALQTDARPQPIDAVLLMGGNVRGGRVYAPDAFFSLEALHTEVQADEIVGVVKMPGWLLSEGVRATQRGAPRPGWMQHDAGVVVQGDAVVAVKGRPLEPDTVYLVATKIADLTNGQSPPLTDYYKKHPGLLPLPKEAYNVHAALMALFARRSWRALWRAVTAGAAEGAAARALRLLDSDGDGAVSVSEMHAALASVLHLQTDVSQQALAKCVHDAADANRDGNVRLQDLEIWLVRNEKMWLVRNDQANALPD